MVGYNVEFIEHMGLNKFVPIMENRLVHNMENDVGKCRDCLGRNLNN